MQLAGADLVDSRHCVKSDRNKRDLFRLLFLSHYLVAKELSEQSYSYVGGSAKSICSGSPDVVHVPGFELTAHA